ncbi:MAG: hypothetical protein ACP5M9_02560 [Candidatus Micrarchaeia archaeon]
MKHAHNKVLSSIIVVAFIIVGFIAVLTFLYVPTTLAYQNIPYITLVMIILLIVMWGLLLILMSKTGYHDSYADPIQILKSRYARGEITKKQYLEMSKDISAKH